MVGSGFSRTVNLSIRDLVESYTSNTDLVEPYILDLNLSIKVTCSVLNPDPMNDPVF